MFLPTSPLGYELYDLINKPIIDKKIIDTVRGRIVFVPFTVSYLDNLTGYLDLGNRELILHEFCEGLYPGSRFRRLRYFVNRFGNAARPYKAINKPRPVSSETRAILDKIRVLSRKMLFVDEYGNEWSLHMIERSFTDHNSRVRSSFIKSHPVAKLVNEKENTRASVMQMIESSLTYSATTGDGTNVRG